MNAFLKKLIKLNPLKISILIVLIGVAAYISENPFLDLMEKKTLDMRFRAREPIPTTGKVVMAVIDEKSLDREGQWPWSRAKMADLVNKLSDAGTRVIAFDIGWFEPADQSASNIIDQIRKKTKQLNINNNKLDRYIQQVKVQSDTDKILADAIKKSKAKVVLGYFLHLNPADVTHYDEKTKKYHEDNIQNSAFKIQYISNKGVIQRAQLTKAASPESNIKIISDSSNYAGYFNMEPDRVDGVVRTLPMVIKYRNQLYAPLALKAIEAYYEKSISIKITDEYGLEELKLDDVKLPVTWEGQMLVNFRGPEKTIKHISITDILHDATPEENLKDKIVLVGATAIGIYDLRVTPFSEIFPGPEIHANLIDSLLAEDFLFRPNWATFFDILAIITAGLFLGFLLPKTGSIFGAGAGIAVFGSYILACNYVFVKMGWVLNMVYPLVVLVLVYVVITAYRYFVEEGQKRFIKNAFSTYLAPTVVKQIMDSPDKLKLGGEKREITAFFSDVQSFTSISEKLNPEELVELLNEFLTEMTDIVLEYEGTVDKFEGDAIIAFFGAPNDMDDHAEKACNASIKMQHKMAELRKNWAASGKPELKMRIGLSTGPAVVGNMGSRNRMDYTMMGDTVNTAARLEGVNKIYGIYTLVGQNTRKEAGNNIFFREIDAINVVGKKEPVTIFQPIDFQDNVDENTLKTVEHYTNGLNAYRNRDWDGAIQHFDKALAITPDDGPSITMIARCNEYKTDPPEEGWNGAFTMKTK